MSELKGKFQKGDIVRVIGSHEQGVYIRDGGGTCKAGVVLHDGIVVNFIPHEALELVKQKERVCEWQVEADGSVKSCMRTWTDVDTDLIGVNGFDKYCTDCGGEVVVKERMCSLGGIEFPAPKIMDLDTDILTDSYVELEYKRYEFKNETDRHTFMIALQAAVTQAVEEAK